MKSENLGAFYKYINKRTSYRPAIGALTDDGGNIKTDDYDKAIIQLLFCCSRCGR